MTRRRAGVFVLDPSGRKVLLVQENNRESKWGIPKGSIEPNEDTFTAAFRELKEEAALDLSNGSYQYQGRKGNVYQVRLYKDFTPTKTTQEIQQVRWIPLTFVYKDIESNPYKYNGFTRNYFKCVRGFCVRGRKISLQSQRWVRGKRPTAGVLLPPIH